MHKFEQTKFLKYPAKFVNEIILDVEKYPEFLPWVGDVRIISKNNNHFVAKMIITFKGFCESYESLVRYGNEDGKYFVNVEAISGPFKKLINKWTIIEANDGCHVDFYIDFTFKSKILDMVVGVFFSIAVEKMINSFEQRAEELYRN